MTIGYLLGAAVVAWASAKVSGWLMVRISRFLEDRMEQPNRMVGVILAGVLIVLSLTTLWVGLNLIDVVVL